MPSIYIFAKQTPFLSIFLIYFYLATGEIRHFIMKNANNSLFFANKSFFKVEKNLGKNTVPSHERC